MSGWQTVMSIFYIPFAVWMVVTIVKDAKFQEECRKRRHDYLKDE